MQYQPRSLQEIAGRKTVESVTYKEGIRQLEIPRRLVSHLNEHYYDWKLECTEPIFHPLLKKAAENFCFDEPFQYVEPDLKAIFLLQLHDCLNIYDHCIIRHISYGITYKGEEKAIDICDYCCHNHESRNYGTVKRYIYTEIMPAEEVMNNITNDCLLYCKVCKQRTLFYFEDYFETDKIFRYITQETTLQVEESDEEDNNNLDNDDWDHLLIDIDE